MAISSTQKVTLSMDEMKNDGRLIPLPTNRYLSVAPNLKEYRRVAAPRTVQFLTRMSLAVKVPLTITSGARSLKDQKGLIGSVVNAAKKLTGNHASIHLRGVAVDIRHDTMPLADKVKLGEYLLASKNRKETIVALEKHKKGPCFHIIRIGGQGPQPTKKATLSRMRQLRKAVRIKSCKQLASSPSGTDCSFFN